MPSKRAAKQRKMRYELTYRNALTDDTLADSARFFSAHYGTYSARGASPDQPIIITPAQLRQDLWPSAVPASSWQDQCLIQAYLGDEDDPDTELIGQIFVTKWKWTGRQVLWVTHLCVHKAHRRRGVATGLVAQIREEAPVLYDEGERWLVGVTAPNPATLLAVANGLGKRVGNRPASLKDALTDNEVLDKVGDILQVGPLDHLKRGKVGNGEAAGSYGGPKILDTGLFMQNEESHELVEKLRSSGLSLTDLPEGHEYVLVFEGI